MKFSHNKKRNTAFIYETLIMEFSKASMKKQNQRKQKILLILKEFFSKDQWTDVIAFPLQRGSKFIEGEIYISIPTAKKNANLFKEPYKKELGRLIIHGSLHLLGIEDKSTEQKKKMTMLEEKFLEDELWRGLIEKS